MQRLAGIIAQLNSCKAAAHRVHGLGGCPLAPLGVWRWPWWWSGTHGLCALTFSDGVQALLCSSCVVVSNELGSLSLLGSSNHGSTSIDKMLACGWSSLCLTSCRHFTKGTMVICGTSGRAPGHLTGRCLGIQWFECEPLLTESSA